jgi:hypothetical protein
MYKYAPQWVLNTRSKRTYRKGFGTHCTIHGLDIPNVLKAQIRYYLLSVWALILGVTWVREARVPVLLQQRDAVFDGIPMIVHLEGT